MAQPFPSIPAPSSTPRSASDLIGREVFRTLSLQALASLQNPRIMGAKIEDVVGRLGADPDMVRQFRAAYGRGPDSAAVLDAIAVFERSLLTPGSRFDRWLAGDESALSPEEQNGYSLFKSLGRVSCHQGVNIGRNPVPAPRNISAAGVTAARYFPRAEPAECREHSALFHDGSAPTLDDAVRRMGVAQLNSTLTDPQVEAIVAYLRTLTGTYRGRPVGSLRDEGIACRGRRAVSTPSADLAAAERIELEFISVRPSASGARRFCHDRERAASGRADRNVPAYCVTTTCW